jgi:hypothetical protein
LKKTPEQKPTEEKLEDKLLQAYARIKKESRRNKKRKENRIQ